MSKTILALALGVSMLPAAAMAQTSGYGHSYPSGYSAVPYGQGTLFLPNNGGQTSGYPNGVTSSPSYFVPGYQFQPTQQIPLGCRNFSCN